MLAANALGAATLASLLLELLQEVLGVLLVRLDDELGSILFDLGHALAIDLIKGFLDLVDRGQLLLLDDVDVLGLGGHLGGSVV